MGGAVNSLPYIVHVWRSQDNFQGSVFSHESWDQAQILGLAKVPLLTKPSCQPLFTFQCCVMLRLYNI